MRVMNKLIIVADDRERFSGVVAYLTGFPDVTISIQRLKVGDYLLGHEIVIERKTLADFVQSIIDGRLFRQTGRIASNSKHPILILEGTAADLAHSEMQREAIQGAMITVGLVYGLVILRSHDPAETARLILYCARQYSRLGRRPLPRYGRRPRDKRKRQIFVLQGLPGIGPIRAENLLKKLGSLQAVFTANREELAAVDDIGPIMAEKIYDLIRETYL